MYNDQLEYSVVIWGFYGISIWTENAISVFLNNIYIDSKVLITISLPDICDIH